MEEVTLHSGGLHLAAHLYLPEGPRPRRVPAVVVCHGFGSRKENHADFAAFLAAHGLAALVFDFRGHGASEGLLDGDALHDVAAALAYLRERPDVDAARLAVRGSSMGGRYAIHAGANFPELKAVVALCPGPQERLYAALTEAREELNAAPLGVRLHIPSLLEHLKTHDIFHAVGRISPRALLLVHAQADELIPYHYSQRLYELAGEPRRLLLVPGGSHTSAQHDPQVHRLVVEWLRAQLGV